MDFVFLYFLGNSILYFEYSVRFIFFFFYEFDALLFKDIDVVAGRCLWNDVNESDSQKDTSWKSVCYA